MDSINSTPPAPEEETSARARTRDSLFLLAHLRFASRPGEHEVRVRNLSPGGLMAELEQPVQIGEAVEMTLRGIGAVTGRIAWATQGRIGVALDQAIDPMKARKPVSARASRR